MSRTTIRRLMRDLNELVREPIDNANLNYVNEDNIFELHANVIIADGPYKGLLIHFLILIPDGFPAASPAGRMAANYPFNGNHHGHIHGDKICNDYLSDFQDFFDAVDRGERKRATGWSPGITLSNLLLVMKQFFADTDCPTPNQDTIKSIFERVEKYTCPSCPHTGAVPYPSLIIPVEIVEPSKSSESSSSSFINPPDQISSADTLRSLESSELPSSSSISPPDQISSSEAGSASDSLTSPITSDPLLERAREILICSASKENIIDNSDIILGYPIALKRGARNKIFVTPIPELTSYEQYMLQLQQHGINSSVHIRTANGISYTHWLPIYINEQHFTSHKDHFYNTIAKICNKDTFSPNMIITTLPCLMNKMVVSIMNGNVYESENAIIAYCQLLHTMLHLIDKPLQQVIEDKVIQFIKNPKCRTKEAVPDIGEFLIILSLSRQYSFYHQAIQRPLLVEFFARKVWWLEQKESEYISSLKEFKSPSGSLKERLSQIDKGILQQHLMVNFKASEVSNKLLIFTTTHCIEWYSTKMEWVPYYKSLRMGTECPFPLTKYLS